MTIDLSSLAGLGQPDILERVSYDAILAEAIADLLARRPEFAGFINLETEPARIILEASAYRETLLRARANDVGRANLLALASGSDLDHLAAFYDVVRMTGESDTRLRERTVLEIAGRSPGGTAERYRAKALGASVHVRDAVVWRGDLSPIVNVAVFSDGPGGFADAVLLNSVSAALNSDAVRMVSDTISVQSAVTSTQAISANIWLLPDVPQSVFDALPQALSEAWAQESGLGFDLTRSWLISRLMRSGVYRVDITAPTADVTADPHEAIAIAPITLTYMGRGQ